MSEEDELEEQFVDIIAAIYNATCADCLDPEPHHLCCNSFFCTTHWLIHEEQKHREVA